MAENDNTQAQTPAPAPSNGGGSGEATPKKLPKKTVMYLFYMVIGIIFLIVMMALFGGKKKQQDSGFNPVLPDPSQSGQILNDKRKQYDFSEGRQSQYGNLDDLFAESVDKTNQTPEERTARRESEDPMLAFSKSLEQTNEALNNFQEIREEQRRQRDAAPAGSTVVNGYNPADEQLKSENAVLKRQMEAQDAALKQMQDLLQQTVQMQDEEVNRDKARHENRVREAEEAKSRHTVSALPSASDGVVSTLSGHAAGGFYGMDGTGTELSKNTIKASVYGRHIVLTGQQVQLRLEEPMMVGTMVIPRGCILTGIVTIGTDRAFISIHTISYKQVLMNVALDVYDLDGQQGLFVPGSLESEALRDLAQDLASNIANTMESATQTGSYINQQTAAEQLKRDLGRGSIQGVARFIDKKLNQIKVTIQDGHQVLLYPHN